MRSQANRGLLICILLFISLEFNHGIAQSQGEDETKKNKFREREATDDALGYPNIDEDALLNTQCPRKLELRWQTEVSSSVYATPLIADINSDGKLDIVVPSFVHYLDVIEGTDGDKLPGWPAFHQSTVHSSPLLYDIDKDGVREIALATYNGEVVFFRASGYMMSEKLEIPRRKVRKDWYVGLHSDPVDRSHPDVHDDQLIEEAAEEKLMYLSKEHTPLSNASSFSAQDRVGTVNISSTANEGKLSTTQIENHMLGTDNGGNVNSSEVEKNVSGTKNGGKVNNSQPENHIEMLKTMGNFSLTTGSANATNLVNRTEIGRRLLEDNESQDHGSKTGVEGAEGHKAATVENDGDLEAEADSSFDLFRDSEELADEYNYDYDDYVDESMWGNEEWTEEKHERIEDYVNVDSHILCTPVIADIDNDGISEMVVAVSYFFDHEYYDNPEHSKELGDIDITKYVAGSIVVFNLDTKQVKWTTPLDLSTDSGNFQAYIYSSPTVIDLDGDGNLDILVGTSFGLFYALDHHEEQKVLKRHRSTF